MMINYSILCTANVNKSYRADFERITLNEAQAIFLANEIHADNIRFEEIAAISYILFEAQGELTDIQLKAVSRLSAFYAIFKMSDDMLMPILARPEYAFEDNIAAILKYQGKTSEVFTRLMINLACSCCKTQQEKKVLLDPVSGKGTTLYDAMNLGYDAVGIEISNKLFVESSAFAEKFMQKAKYKHKAKKDKLKDEKAKKIADVFTLEYSTDKNKFYAGDINFLKIINGDTVQADKFIKKNSVDMIVGDLPYGVQHANKNSQTQSRSAVNLLTDAIPFWIRIMKKNASLVISFNEFTTPKDDIINILEKNDMQVLKEQCYYDYQHMVDSSIKRNIVVAVKN